MRNADDDPGEQRWSRDPAELDAEADTVEAEERQLALRVAELADELEQATAARTAAEEAHRAEEDRLAAVFRAAADRREGWPG